MEIVRKRIFGSNRLERKKWSTYEGRPFFSGEFPVDPCVPFAFQPVKTKISFAKWKALVSAAHFQLILTNEFTYMTTKLNFRLISRKAIATN